MPSLPSRPSGDGRYPKLRGDTWHETLEQAEAVALKEFGIIAAEWKTAEGII